MSNGIFPKKFPIASKIFDSFTVSTGKCFINSGNDVTWETLQQFLHNGLRYS